MPMTPMTTDDAVAALYQQAAQIVGTAAGPASASNVESAYRTLTGFADLGDRLSLGLLPLALALLIFHENFQAGTGDGRFRVAYVLGRAAAVAALIHPWTYGRLCGLITTAAGGHGGWMSGDALLGSATTSVDGLRGAWTDFAGDDPGISDSFSALMNMLPLVGIWLVLVGSLLLAYIAGVLLGLSQAVILSVLLAVGKTCITVTLVPGVGLGPSWARSLAKVAAWSTVAGILTALMVHAMPDLRQMVRNMAYTTMLRTAGQFVVLAICTFSVPVITEKIFTGAAPAGNAALAAVTRSWHGARTMGRLFSSGDGSARRGPTRDGHGGDERGGDRAGGGHRRPHKISPSLLRQGLAAASSLALAPVALAAARIGGRGRDRGLAPLVRTGETDRVQGRPRGAVRAVDGSSTAPGPGPRAAVTELRATQALGGPAAATFAAKADPERTPAKVRTGTMTGPASGDRSSRLAAGSRTTSAVKPAPGSAPTPGQRIPPTARPGRDEETT